MRKKSFVRGPSSGQVWRVIKRARPRQEASAASQRREGGQATPRLTGTLSISPKLGDGAASSHTVT